MSFLPKGNIGSGGSRSLQDLVLALPCRDMMAAMLKSVAQGLIVHLSSITSSSGSPSHQDSRYYTHFTMTTVVAATTAAAATTTTLTIEPDVSDRARD